ncbi:hypothetical protein JKP88DRAFT_317421 [Tribonema minus]|uniref:Pentatricopeptide repeat-containing protein-mitochondrial domain-containing protein n=1 Tax=Tribonema minus TaxID=303371 RepID=A0A836CEZ1_9STRA|nr:hypothetical protein JKP88DRAFT_317421 [Tribonema minus]
MLRAHLLGRYVVNSIGSGVPTQVALRSTLTTWAFVKYSFSGDARDPGAAGRESPYWHRHHLSVLQRASLEHGIGSNFATRQQHTSRGGKPPSTTPACRIHTLGRQKKWNDALQIFKSIEEPTALEARALLATMAYNHQPRHAMFALRQLRNTGAVASHDYQLIIHAYAKELPLEALELLHQMEREGFGWTHRACSTVLQAFGKAGRLSAALQLIDVMEQRNCNPSDGIKLDVRSWNVLLNAIGRAGQVTEMMAWYREMLKSGGLQPDTVLMTTLLDNAGKAGELGIAEGIWREMRDRQLAPDVKAYNALITCYATARQPDKAEQVIAEMCQSAAVKPDAIALTSCVPLNMLMDVCYNLMQAYINDERLDDADRVIGRMRAAGADPISGTWTTIICAADAVGDIKKVDRLYRDALLSKAINPYRPELSNAIKDAAGNTLPVGTVMDLHWLDRATGQAAIRHELRVRWKAAGSLRRGKPLYIITGQGGGLLIAAVSDTLKSQGIQHVLPAAQPGRIYCTFQ